MRHSFLSYIRIISVVFVVLSHAFAPYGAWDWIKSDKSSFFSISNAIIEPFVSMMPLLTFLSGFLFFTIQNKYPSFKYLFKKKFERLIVPMVFFGIVYYLLFENMPILNLHTINTILSGYIILWYCNMLFLCFLVAYPITKYIKSNYLKLTILLVSFILIYINFPAILGLGSLHRLFFYFYSGFLFSEIVSKYEYDVTYFNKPIVFFGVLFIISYLLYEYNTLTDLNNKLIKVLFGNTLRISFISFTVLLFRRFESQLKYSSFVKFLDQNSFGCYIFHYPVIYFLYKNIFFNSSLLSHYWYFPIVSFVTATIVAYFVTYYFRKTKIGLYFLG